MISASINRPRLRPFDFICWPEGQAAHSTMGTLNKSSLTQLDRVSSSPPRSVCLRREQCFRLNEQPRRRSIYQHVIPCAGILVLATIIMLPVFVRAFPAGFDAVRHYRWTSQFIDALRDGALYPRWLPGANDGQGSPVPLYYPPLTFYVAAGFSLLTGKTLLGISLSCWLALALSGLTMYAFARSFLSYRLSFGAAAFYMMAPYHLLDLYQGATVSEFWSFVWVPLLLDAVRRVSAGPGLNAVAYLALSYALLVFTHVPLLLVTSLTLLIYAVLLTRNLRVLFSMAAGLALGAGIAAVFLIPVLFETRYVKLFFRFDYRNYFLFEHVRLALASTRFSGESAYTNLLDTDLVAVGLLALYMVSSVLMFINRRSGKQDFRSARLCLAIWSVTGLSILMSTRLSTPIWRITPGLPFLFFPCRWLVIASAGTSLVFAFSIWGVLKRPGSGRVLEIVALAIVVALNLVIGALAIVRAPVAFDGFAAGLARRDTREYRPVWWDGQSREDVWQNAAVVESGNAEVRAIDQTGIEQSYAVRAATESVIALRPLYFPGWVARLDASKIEIAPSADGHVQLSIEPGEHTLTLRFEDTWPRTLGKVVSAASVLIFLAVLYGARRRVKLPSET